MRLLSKLLLLLIPMSIFSAPFFNELGCYDLWYYKNSIFAYEGYQFKTPEAKRVFLNYDSSHTGVFRGLNQEEQKEFNRVKRVEKSKGCTKRDISTKLTIPTRWIKSPVGYKVANIKTPLNVRLQPSLRGKIIDRLSSGVADIDVQAISRDRRWVFIEYSNYFNYHLKGWVSFKYLKKQYYIESGLSYRERLELLNKIDKNSCDKNSYKELRKYLNKDNHKNTFYGMFKYVSEYKCKRLRVNTYSCHFVLESNYIAYGFDSEHQLIIDFTAKKYGDVVEVAKVNLCTQAD